VVVEKSSKADLRVELIGILKKRLEVGQQVVVTNRILPTLIAMQ
jgi:hypothetical protein